MATVPVITTEGTTKKVRISTAIVPESNLNPYLEYVQRSEIPKYEGAAGLTSFCVLQRPFVAYVEILIISFWQSEHVLTRFFEAQSLTSAATEIYGAIQLEGRNYAVLVSGEGKVRNAEGMPYE